MNLVLPFCDQVEGLTIIIDDMIGSTGLELKVDPGVPFVYAGFGGTPQHPATSATLRAARMLTLPSLECCKP